MSIKDIILPGTLVEMRSGDIAIVAISEYFHPKDLIICWNNGSCLELKDYTDDLVYKNPQYVGRYTIDRIYGLGSFFDPYSMKAEYRRILWDRYKEGFSSLEVWQASTLWAMIDSLSSENADDIFVKKEKDFIEIKNNEVTIKIPSLFMPNLKPDKTLSLKDIINGKIL